MVLVNATIKYMSNVDVVDNKLKQLVEGKLYA